MEEKIQKEDGKSEDGGIDSSSPRKVEDLENDDNQIPHHINQTSSPLINNPEYQMQ